MSRTSAELLVLAALAAVAWLALDAGFRAPGPGSATAGPPAPPALDPVGQGLAERTARLRDYTVSPPARGAATRNPFSFPGSVRDTSRETVENHVEPDVAVADARPEVTLAGIAEDGAGGVAVRTAVLSAGGQLVFAKEGDRILSRFLVARIATDAVQLKDLERGDVFTLAFK